MNEECKHDHHTEEGRNQVKDHIEKYGCHIVLLNPVDDLPGFGYTIGLYEKYNHPEIICFGLSNDVLMGVLNDACSDIKEGCKFTTDKREDHLIDGYNVEFLSVNSDYYANYVGYARWYYHNVDFPLLQLVWPDKSGVFSWEDNFNPDRKFKQPLLDRNTDFKFYEERNLGVFTTQYVIDGSPILFVLHDKEEGDWQFQGGEDFTDQDIRLVALENVTKMDPTVNDLFNLGMGERAWRTHAGDEWQREKQDEE